MNAPARPIRLYRFQLSGHAHRAELFLSLLGLRYEPVDVDLAKGASHTEEFLRLNEFGQVPVIEDGGVVVADSNAILVYLAQKYDTRDTERWLPRDPLGAARVQRWLSVAAGQIAFGPAAARAIVVFGAQRDPAEFVKRAHALFVVMEKVLADSSFLAATHPTLADVAAYSYIARAPEGNVALDAYPNLRRWLARVEALPGFIAMPATRVGLAA